MFEFVHLGTRMIRSERENLKVIGENELLHEIRARRFGGMRIEGEMRKILRLGYRGFNPKSRARLRTAAFTSKADTDG